MKEIPFKEGGSFFRKVSNVNKFLKNSFNQIVLLFSEKLSIINSVCCKKLERNGIHTTMETNRICR